MAKTVEQAISDYLSRLTPLGGEAAAAKSHRESIKTCLEQSFGPIGFFRSGSFGFGTSVRGHSDVDYFAVLPRNQLAQNSTDALRSVATRLDSRFPNTGVKVDSPAVSVPFGISPGERHEIVPVWHVKNIDGVRLFGMPDRNGAGCIQAQKRMHAS
jgi:tRNA nucleotidyltransferase (CCA-adding enzyme)